MGVTVPRVSTVRVCGARVVRGKTVRLESDSVRTGRGDRSSGTVGNSGETRGAVKRRRRRDGDEKHVRRRTKRHGRGKNEIHASAGSHSTLRRARCTLRCDM